MNCLKRECGGIVKSIHIYIALRGKSSLTKKDNKENFEWILPNESRSIFPILLDRMKNVWVKISVHYLEDVRISGLFTIQIFLKQFHL